MTMEQDILRLIGDSIPQFSKGQRAIGNYILTSPEEAAFLTAAQLSRKVGVSESTVVRFALELGFDGYPAMQMELRSLTLKRLEETRGKPPEVTDDHKPSVFDGDIQKLRQTADTLDSNALNSAAEAMVQARQIHVLGLPGADLLAIYLTQRLRDLFPEVQLHLFRDEQEVCQSLLDVEQGDLVVVMGFLLPRRALERTIRILYHMGASVLLLTDETDTLWHPYVKWILTAVRDTNRRVRSLTAPMSLINVLLSAILDHGDDRMSARLTQLEDIRRMVRK